jgi:hypothetical protein
MLKELTQKEFKKLRYEQWIKQGKCCPILKQRILYRKAVFDHKHKNKKEEIGEDGKGLLRGVLHFQANSWEGKITNAFKRYGLHKFNISLPEALRNLAEYIDNPPMKQEYMHPSERPKPKKLGKREYNRICKYYFQIFPRRKKLPGYPKSGKMSKRFEELLNMVNNMYFKKDKRK